MAQAVRMADDEDIRKAAAELVERYGKDAREIATARVDALIRPDQLPERDIAIRVLSAVEWLLG